MLPSWRLAYNTLGGRRGRTLLMIGAITLASSLVVAVSCAIGSVQASVEKGIAKILGRSDARIIHSANGRFDEALLEAVRGWHEVQLATGRLGGSLTLAHADGRKNPKTGDLIRSTTFALGVDFAMEPNFRDQPLLAGRRPEKPHEILIDPMTADELHASVGDVLEVQRFGDPINLTVVGIYERQRLGTLQRPFVDVDRHTLQEAMDRPKQLTSIVIIVKKGIEVAAFCAAHQNQLPKQLTLEPSEYVRSGFDRQVMAGRFALTIGSVLTFICAAFIIVTALTTAVTERQREMAVTRCIGASRGQLFAAQLWVGLSLGLIGAFAGVPLGIGLAGVLAWYFAELLPAGLSVEGLGIGLAIVGSISAGLLGAMYPAWMASRVPPLQAMTVQARPRGWIGIVWCGLIAAAFIVVQPLLMWPDDASQRFYAYAYGGLPSLHFGYFILAIPLLVLVTLLLSGPISAMLRLPRGMLRRSLLVMPYRNGFTAGALMVGIAILVSNWASALSLLDDWLGRIKFADGFAFRSTGIPPQQQQAIVSLPFVTATVPIGYMPLRVYDRQIFGVQGLAPSSVTCIGFDPQTFFTINTVTWAAGDPAVAVRRLKRGDAIIVADRFLVTQKVKLGDRLKLGAGRVQKEYEIVGAVSSPGLDIATQLFGIRNQYMEFSISMVFMDWDEVVRTFDNRDAHMLQINIDPIAAKTLSDEQISNRIGEVAPGVQFKSGREITGTINKIAGAMLTVQSTVAFAALVLASFAVGNVILANIHARRFEYGVLRAVGAQRGLIARLICGEAALLALTGALTGSLMGLHLAWVSARFYRDLAGLPVQLVVPVIPAAVGWVVLLILTLLAALPAVLSIVRQRPSELLAAGRAG